MDVKWVFWIKECLQSTTISALVNGSPSKEFSPQRGIRQEGPLALLLFIVVVEGLSGLMREVVAKNMFKGFSVGKERSPVELFQYADYTIFFGEPTIRNIMVLKSMLRCYELALGLKLNFSKSSFRGVGVKRNTLEFFVNILNCMLMSFPFVYIIDISIRKTTI